MSPLQVHFMEVVYGQVEELMVLGRAEAAELAHGGFDFPFL